MPDDKQPEFNGWLSVGAFKEKDFNIDGKPVPIKILGYYDKIGNITYVPESNAISFDMPFSYDMNRLNAKDNNVYIHRKFMCQNQAFCLLPVVIPDLLMGWM